MATRIYIETTVPSAYVSTRTDAGSVYRRDATRSWWLAQLGFYDAYVSDAVVLELERGEWSGKSEALALIARVPRLVVDDEAIGVAERYIRERLVPNDVAGDAMHLAIASVHQVDYLATWNIRHLANPNKLRHLVVVNRRMGLLTPQVVTPDSLWQEDVS